MSQVIPPNINEMTRLDAARFYRDELGWTLHAVNGPDQGKGNEKGKKPLHNGWQNRTVEDADNNYLTMYFSDGTAHNIAKINRLPEITIDLDSKQDDGKTAEAWVAAHPELNNVPCERTAGGKHLHCRCNDVPEAIIKAAGKGGKLQGELAPGLNYEIFFRGNTVIAPSTHKSGVKYRWTQTGPIPEVPWTMIAHLFPIGKRTTTSAKASEAKPAIKDQDHWYTAYKGNLASLDIVALAQELGIYGKLLDADQRKHTALCPWAHLHSGDQTQNADDTSSVVFEAKDDKWPAFKCLHTSHGDPKLKEFLAYAESKSEGIVDRHCKKLRVWEKGQTNPDGRSRLPLPGPYRPDSEFAADAGKILGASQKDNTIFRRANTVTEVDNDPSAAPNVKSCIFRLLKPARAITLVEKFAEVGALVEDDNGNKVFMPLSMTTHTAEVLLQAPQFNEQLRTVDRILDMPVPFIDENGAIAYPTPGYDPRFRTYLSESAPQREDMPLEQAKGLLLELFNEFCFANPQSLVHAIAAFITPFCRGLFSTRTARTPITIYKANRERAGKDYLAGLTTIAYEGRKDEDTPLTSDAEETRKKLTAALIAGRKKVHFANCKGNIDNGTIEMFSTTEVWTDRVLGENREVTLPNEMDISLSANMGLTYTADLANRARIINLHLDTEDANSRVFKRTDLHKWLLDNRGRFVSALAALVKHWDNNGRPAGPTPFTSFPEWARVVGGIMVTAGLGDPCLPPVDDGLAIDGDQQTTDMKQLFAVARAQFGDRWVKKDEVAILLTGPEGEGLFSWLDMSGRSGRTSFAKLLPKFVGRILGGIRLLHQATAKTAKHHTFQFILDADYKKTTKTVVSSVIPSSEVKSEVNLVNIVNLIRQESFEDKHSVSCKDVNRYPRPAPKQVDDVDEVDVTVVPKPSSEVESALISAPAAKMRPADSIAAASVNSAQANDLNWEAAS